MNIQYCLSVCLLLFLPAMGLAQGQPPVQLGVVSTPATSGSGSQSKLTKFDLDFHGGIPKELVAAIQTASGRPLNVIIPEEFANTMLPALKMKNINVYELFTALRSASERKEKNPAPGYGLGAYTTSSYSSYVFSAAGGNLSDDTIWYFSAEKPQNVPQSIPKVCRFYSLARYLEAGTTVDDITTAIKTGAQMLNEATIRSSGVAVGFGVGIGGKTNEIKSGGPLVVADGLNISFHKDTKLLIAVGDQSKLEIIDAVLKALDPQGGGYSDRLRNLVNKGATNEPPKPESK